MPKIAREPLTVAKVNAAKPTGKLYLLRDATVPGLVLRVSPDGVKTWAVQWGRGQARNMGRHLTLEGARNAARKVLGEIAEHGAPVATLEAIQAAQAGKASLTFGDFMRDHYGPHVEATAKAGKATVAAIKVQFADLYDRPLREITRADFDTFKVKRLKAKRQPATINRDLDRIKAALSQAVAWDLLPANPLAGVKRIKRDIEERVRYLSPAEEKRLRKALDARETRRKAERVRGDAWRKERDIAPLGAFQGYTDHLLPMTLLALNTGLRRGEIVQLTWADIDLHAKRLTVRAGYAKSGKARHIPLNSEVVALLKTVKKSNGGEGRLFSVLGIGKAWERLMTAAKIEEFRFHDLRHTFASKLVMAGVDLNTVRELLGHGDIKMTLRYAHLAPEHKAAAVELLVG
jgi:integrase